MVHVSTEEAVRDLAHQALKDTAPGFVKAVDRAKKEHLDYVILSFRAFHAEPHLFFLATQYASLRGVALLIAPEEEPQ
jgi:hypothetical protein